MTRMQQFLLAGLVGCWLAEASSAGAAPDTVRAGSIKSTAQPTRAESAPKVNTYNPTLLARRQPQPVMAEEIPPVDREPELAPLGSGNRSLLDDFAPPKPLLPTSPLMQNPIMDDASLADMPAEPWSSGSWFRSGSHYAEVDFLVFERQRPKRRREVIATDLALAGRVLTTYNTTFGNEPGVRATLGQNLFRDYLNRDHSIEATFTGINQFQSDDGIRGQDLNSLVTTGIVGLNSSDTVTYNHTSNFLSYEANYRIRTRLERDRMLMGPDGSWTRQYTHGHTFSILLGLRHVTIDEEFLLIGRRDNVLESTYGGNYRVNAENDLLGAQIGGELRSQYETWSWGVLGKAGAYVNFSEVNHLVTSATVPIYGAQPALQDSAFVGEFRLFGAYNLSPNWTLRSSFDLIGIAGSAQAPYNVDFTLSPEPDVNNHGFVTLIGMSFGMEFVW